MVTTSASPLIAAGSMVPGGPLHLAERGDAHPKTPANGYPRRPPRGPVFSWAPDRKRALVRGSLVLGPACQQGRYFVAVTGSRNPPEPQRLRCRDCRLRSAFPRHRDLCYPCPLPKIPQIMQLLVLDPHFPEVPFSSLFFFYPPTICILAQTGSSDRTFLLPVLLGAKLGSQCCIGPSGCCSDEQPATAQAGALGWVGLVWFGFFLQRHKT